MRLWSLEEFVGLIAMKIVANTKYIFEYKTSILEEVNIEFFIV